MQATAVGGSGKLLLTTQEASERLSLNRTTLYEKLLATGALASVKVGKRRLIAVADLEEYVEKLRSGARAG